MLQNNAGRGLAGQPGGGKGVEGEGEGGCLCHRWLLQGMRWNKDDNRAVDSKIRGGKNEGTEQEPSKKTSVDCKICAIVVRQIG